MPKPIRYTQTQTTSSGRRYGVAVNSPNGNKSSRNSASTRKANSANSAKGRKRTK